MSLPQTHCVATALRPDMAPPVTSWPSDKGHHPGHSCLGRRYVLGQGRATTAPLGAESTGPALDNLPTCYLTSGAGAGGPGPSLRPDGSSSLSRNSKPTDKDAGGAQIRARMW